MTSRSEAPARSGALIRNSAIAMLMNALIVPFFRAAAVERRSECRASTIAATASNPPIRDAGYLSLRAASPAPAARAAA